MLGAKKIELLIAWLVTSVSLFVISRLPLGIEGVLNALVKPVLSALAFPITFLTFGLFALVVNAMIFGLAAALVKGFRLKWGV